jgi:hypothetical protein
MPKLQCSQNFRDSERAVQRDTERSCVTTSRVSQNPFVQYLLYPFRKPILATYRLYVALLVVEESNVSLVSSMRRLVECWRSSSKMSSETQSHIPNMPNGVSIFHLTFLPLFCWLSSHTCSKTVTALDVVYALKRSGRTLYGFGA